VLRTDGAAMVPVYCNPSPALCGEPCHAHRSAPPLVYCLIAPPHPRRRPGGYRQAVRHCCQRCRSCPRLHGGGGHSLCAEVCGAAEEAQPGDCHLPAAGQASPPGQSGCREGLPSRGWVFRHLHPGSTALVNVGGWSTGAACFLDPTHSTSMLPQTSISDCLPILDCCLASKARALS
jgi:hypothetical protein